MIFDDDFNYGYDDYIDRPIVVNPGFKPHYILHLGCGCTYPIPGPWIDGKPTGVIRSGAEPGNLCRKHLSAYYAGQDLRFP